MRPPQNWRSARVTLAIAAAIAAAWLAVLVTRQEQLAIAAGAFIPERLNALQGGARIATALATPLTATLLHSSLLHVAFNLFFLLICGRAIEHILGGRGVAILYVVGAYAAAGAHYLLNPHSPVPMIGASGGVWAIVGAWAMLFGQNRVKIRNAVLARWLHALWLAAAWVILQILVAFTLDTGNARIAIAFHVGGFLAGLALAKPLLLLRWRGA
jgi:membrane associated rhomboid family serine protease